MAKAIKIGIIVLAPIVLVVGVWLYSSSGGPSPRDSFLVYNVVTGETKTVSPNDTAFWPMADDEGRRRWFPATRVDGQLLLSEPYDQGVERAAERENLSVNELLVERREDGRVVATAS
jgi:hypothetical protein